MKNLLLIITIFSFITSCNLQRWCTKRYPPISSADTVTMIEYRSDTIFRDTVIEIKIPGDTIVDSILVPCSVPEGISLDEYRVQAESELCFAQAWLDEYPTQMRMELIQKDMTITARLDSALREVRHWKTKYTEIKETLVKEVKHVPGFYKFALWWFVVSLFIMVVYVVIKAIKK
jgi:hypothetical protein